MKALIAWYFIVSATLIFFIVDLCGTTATRLSYQVQDVRSGPSRLTRRPVNQMDVLVVDRCVSLTGLMRWCWSEVVTVEITEEASSKVKIGAVVTYEELEAMRGRSNLGRAWDWLKTPR